MSIRQMRDYCIPRNKSLEDCKVELLRTHKEITSPAQEFFVKELLELDKSTGLEDMGSLRVGLVACTFVVYVLHYFSLFRGLETSGKVSGIELILDDSNDYTPQRIDWIIIYYRL